MLDWLVSEQKNRYALNNFIFNVSILVQIVLSGKLVSVAPSNGLNIINH